MGATSGGLSMSIRMIDNFSSVVKQMDKTLSSFDATIKRTSQDLNRMASATNKISNNNLMREMGIQNRILQQRVNNEEKANKTIESIGLRHQSRLEEIYARQQNVFPQKANSGINAFNLQNLSSALYIFKNIYDFAAKIVKKLSESMDEVMSQKARLNLYNTSGYSTGQMYQYLAQTALQSRSDMGATAELTNRLLAAGVYQGPGATPKTIDTVGLINKALVASGGTSREVQSVLLQLSQGLAQGQLQGQELKAIRQYAPYLGNIIIEGLNKQGVGQYSLGDLKELGAGGELTTERVLKSIEIMADKINEDFEKMPKTWGQAMTNLNTLWSSFLNLLNESDSGVQILYDTMWKFTDFLSSSDAAQFWENLALAANTFFTLASMGLDLVAQGLMWLVDNIDAVIGVASILFTIMAIGWIATHWQIMAVVLILVAVINAFDTLGISGIKVLASIVGGVAVLIEIIKSLAEGIKNGLCAAFYTVEAVAYTVFSAILSAIYVVAAALDTVFGSDLATSVSDSLGKYMSKAGEAYKKANDALEPDKKSRDWGDVYNEAYDKVMGIQDSVASFKTTMSNIGSPGTLGNIGNLGDLSATNGALDTNVKGGKLDSAGEVDLSNEDIQLLRDIAAREYLINISTSSPVMTNNFGDIRETADINKIMDELARMADEELATSVVAG